MSDKTLEFLNAVEVIENIEDILPDKIITKEKAVYYIMRMMGNKDENFSYTGKWGGLSKNSPYAALSEAAVDLGIASIDKFNQFRPEKPVSFTDTVKMIFNALGYRADSSEQYYNNLIGKHRLINQGEINDISALRENEFFIMLKNALELPLMITLSYGQSNSYQADSSKTALSEYLNIYKLRGIAETTEFTSLKTKKRSQEGSIIISDKTIFYTEIKLDPFEAVGREITAYYTEDDYDILNMVYYKYTDIKSQLLLSDDIRDYKNNSYYVEKENGTIVRFNISPQASIIYNGVALTDEDGEYVTPTLMKPVHGEVILAATQSGGSYDLVKIWDYNVGSVQNIDKNEHLIVLRDGMGQIDVSDTIQHRAVITDVDGNSLSITALEAWDVLSIAEALDGGFVKVIACGGGVTGVVTEIQDEGIMLEGELFKLIPSLRNDNSKLPPLDSLITAYMDNYGMIAAFELSEQSGWRSAYAIAVNVSKGLDGCFQIKVLDEDGEVKIYASEQSVTIDAKTYKDPNTAKTAMAVNTVFKYKLSKSGEIYVIDTPVKGEGEHEESLRQKAAGSYWYKNYVPSFGGVIFPQQDAVIFSIPAKAEPQDRDYKVIPLTRLIHDKTYEVVGYSDKRLSLSDKYIVIKENTSDEISTKEIVTLIYKTSTAVTDSGELVYKYYGIGSAGRKEFIVYPEQTEILNKFSEKNIKNGDLVRLSADSKNEVYNVQKVFDGETKEFHSDIGTGNPNAEYGNVLRLSYGTAVMRDTNLLQLRLKNIQNSLETYRENGTVIIYEKSGAVSVGSFNDIVPEITSLVVDMSYARPRTFIIYK